MVVESKNYSRTVPKDEVDKFERDLEQSRANIGIMISLGHSI